jgi:uncharacterized membrane protein YbhN (UPF0104 family)
VGLAVSVGLLWWCLHDVPLADVWARIRDVRVLPFLGSIATVGFTLPLRAIRWRYLLHHEGRALPFRALYHATAIGLMSNNLLPVRAGELIRAFAVQRLSAVRLTTGFASIVMERVLDGVTLVALLATALWLGGISTDASVGLIRIPFVGDVAPTLPQIARVAGALFGCLALAALAVVHWPGHALALAQATSQKLLGERWARSIVRVLAGLLAGLDALRSPSRFAGVVFWSAVLWLTNSAAFWLGFVAFAMDEAPWSAALMLTALISFGVAIPSSPGFFGPFEAATRLTLALYGIGAGPAVSFAIGVHLGGFALVSTIGLWSLARADLRLADLLRGVAEEGERASQPDTM